VSLAFRILIASPPDREELVAEIFFDDVRWAEVNQEHSSLEVEFYPRPDRKPWQMELQDALDSLGEQNVAYKIAGVWPYNLEPKMN
jgi:hypothetical protein